ncbi:hypothetical protein Tco_0696092 [Tanacetum coccineum]
MEENHKDVIGSIEDGEDEMNTITPQGLHQKNGKMAHQFTKTRKTLRTTDSSFLLGPSMEDYTQIVE